MVSERILIFIITGRQLRVNVFGAFEDSDFMSYALGFLVRKVVK